MLTYEAPPGVTVTPLGFIDVPNILRLCGGRSRTWLYDRIRNDPTFPKLPKIAGRRQARFAELLVWIERQAEK